MSTLLNSVALYHLLHPLTFTVLALTQLLLSLPLIQLMTLIDPLTEHINLMTQVVYLACELCLADPAVEVADLLVSVELDLDALGVVAEGTVENLVKLRGGLLGWDLS